MSAKFKVPKLSKTDSRKLLTSNKSLARIATVNGNGSPHVVPVWFLFKNGSIYIPTPLRTLKARNVRISPQISIVIDQYEGKLAAKGMLIKGKARVITGEESSRINYLIHKKYMEREKLREEKWKEFMREDDGTIVVPSYRISSWDFTKLDI
jgi:nitroimidazol reductase NimA-like FMN-containing flavoprotein (pyridoxamine 5'-phosphate oxidase superfamily)